MSFNKDELEAPEWINSDFFKLVLENSEKRESVKIIDYKITPASMRGDHFASIMFRVNIQYSTNKTPNGNILIIIKTLPVEEGYKKEMLSTIDLFETEIKMYTKILPKCAEILKNAGVKDLLAPRLLYQSLEPHKVVVFEDLKELGYSMNPSFSVSDTDLKIIFAKLAQMHASTFKMAADGNTEMKKLQGSLFSIPNLKEMPMFSSSLTQLLDLLDTIPELKLCADKIRRFKPDALTDKCIKSLNIPGSYNVLNHGDYHVKNMMFKHTNDKISEVVLLDFQICHWGSPAHDLLYMGVIVPYEIRDEIYKHYFTCFIDILSKTDFKGKLPTFDQLQAELHKFRHIDLFMTASIAPFMNLTADEMDFEMEDFVSGKISSTVFYRAERYVALVKKLMPIYLEKGYFDDVINEN